ncbi:hypothetical protein ACK3TF_001320 [Chlorella vulgaris]
MGLRQAASVRAAQLPPDLRLRPGVPADRPAFLRGILREKLNPLALDPSRFTVAERGSGEHARVLGFGQIKPLGQQALELSTLIVDEAERGNGVGSALIASLAAQAGDTPLYLTTLATTAALYKRHGFEEIARGDAPPLLQLEYLIGLGVAWLVTRQRLVLMRRVGNSAAAQQQLGEQAAGSGGKGR